MMPLQLRRGVSSVSVKPPVSKKMIDSVETHADEIQASSDPFEYENINHAPVVLSTLARLRQKKLFTDVILATPNREFSCHRAVLIAGSKYFEAMFLNDHRESKEMVVQINGMEDDVMEILLEYLYTSRVAIDSNNAQLLLEASNLFQIDSLRKVCCKFLEAQLDPCNCIEMKEFAERLCLSSLFKKSSHMIAEKFADVVLYEEFLELPKSRVIDYIRNDDINVSHEEIVFEAVKRWVAYDAANRSEDFAELLSYVRIPLIHPTYFMNVIECDEQVSCNPTCQPLLQEARRYHILGNELNSERTRPRHSTGCSVSVVIVGGYDRIGGYNVPYVDAYNPTTNCWSSLPKLPTFTKSEYAVTSFRNSIIVSGGKIHSRDVWLYQSSIKNWAKIAPLCRGRWRHRMITLGGHVYCVGGYDGKNKLLSVEQYDSISNSWREVSYLLCVVSIFTLAVSHDKLHVIGTDDVNEPCKVQLYEPERDIWSMKSQMPMPCNFVSAATLGGVIHVIGSGTSGGNSICCYDTESDFWTSISFTEDFVLSQCGVIVCGGTLYITGGKGDNNEVSDVVYCYNKYSKKLRKVTSMPRPSCFHSCATIHHFKSGKS